MPMRKIWNNQYEQLRKIGEGASGRVMLAKDLKPANLIIQEEGHLKLIDQRSAGKSRQPCAQSHNRLPLLPSKGHQYHHKRLPSVPFLCLSSPVGSISAALVKGISSLAQGVFTIRSALSSICPAAPSTI